MSWYIGIGMGNYLANRLTHLDREIIHRASSLFRIRMLLLASSPFQKRDPSTQNCDLLFLFLKLFPLLLDLFVGYTLCSTGGSEAQP